MLRAEEAQQHDVYKQKQSFLHAIISREGSAYVLFLARNFPL